MQIVLVLFGSVVSMHEFIDIIFECGRDISGGVKVVEVMSISTCTSRCSLSFLWIMI